jgi:hypothetical protein
MPTSRRRSFFPCLTRIAPAPLIEIGLGQRQRLVDPQPGAPEHDDQTVEAIAVSGETGVAQNRDDLIDCQRVGRVALAFVARRPASAESRSCSSVPAAALEVRGRTTAVIVRLREVAWEWRRPGWPRWCCLKVRASEARRVDGHPAGALRREARR